VFSNCEQLEVFLDGNRVATLERLADQFEHLAWPPFELDTSLVGAGRKPELRIDGYLAGEVVLSRSFSGDTDDDSLLADADDAQICVDGRDATRVWLLCADRFGNPRPYVQGELAVTLETRQARR
jgi:beta-galactosidase